MLGSAGASTLGLGTALEPLRPYLIGLTFAFLAVAFYLTYRPEHAPADCCTLPSPSLKRFQKAVLWLVTLFALFTLLVPQLLARRAEHGAVSVPVTASLQTVLLRVDRIACRSCAAVIEQRLREVSGVHMVEVDIPKRQVLVHYDPHRVQPSRIQAALEQAGFPAEALPIARQDTARQNALTR